MTRPVPLPVDRLTVAVYRHSMRLSLTGALTASEDGT